MFLQMLNYCTEVFKATNDHWIYVKYFLFLISHPSILLLFMERTAEFVKDIRALPIYIYKWKLSCIIPFQA